MISAIAREEEKGSYIQERSTMIFLESDFRKGQVIIKNVLIDFLDSY